MSSLEDPIRAACARGDYEAAVTTAIKGYGPQIMGYLVATMRGEEAAGEVFAQFCADLWTGIPQFDWRCSFRTWSYVLARNAGSRYRRDPWNERAKALDTPVLLHLEKNVRVSTLTVIRRERRNILSELRDQLAPEDRELLVLRVDKELAWNEVARVMADHANPADEELRALAAALRKRFQRVKKHLREQAEAKGLT